MRLHTGLRERKWSSSTGFPRLTLSGPSASFHSGLRLDDLVCIVDSARRTGWKSPRSVPAVKAPLVQAIALSDPRSESALETHGRLLWSRRTGAGSPAIRADRRIRTQSWTLRHGLAERSLGHRARWPRLPRGPGAVRRDRTKANATAIDGWRLLRFTWMTSCADPRRQRRCATRPRGGLAAAKTWPLSL